MKIKGVFIISIISVLFLFSACVEESGDQVIVTEFDIEYGYFNVLTIDPPEGYQFEFDEGVYVVNGELRKSDSQSRADQTAEWPSKLIIKLEVSTPKKAGLAPIDKGKNTALIKIAIDPKTGKFKTNKFNIKNTLVVDSKKNQSLKVFIKAKGGMIPSGDKIWYTYWPSED